VSTDPFGDSDVSSGEGGHARDLYRNRQSGRGWYILSSPQGCADVTYLVSIGEPHNELPLGFNNVARRLRLLFADHVDGEYGPAEEDVRRIIELAESLRTSAGKVLIHCEAGVSRSSAAGLTMYAYWFGVGREREALEWVLAQRPIARPNRRMVSLADELLGRGGRLMGVVEEFG
jgi:predicted protein tyrosine phosphatase